ncbi:MAG: hypothetical protein ACKVQA_26150 [Burkholderiales bacterium]
MEQAHLPVAAQADHSPTNDLVAQIALLRSEEQRGQDVRVPTGPLTWLTVHGVHTEFQRVVLRQIGHPIVHGLVQATPTAQPQSAWLCQVEWKSTVLKSKKQAAVRNASIVVEATFACDGTACMRGCVDDMF